MSENSSSSNSNPSSIIYLCYDQSIHPGSVPSSSSSSASASPSGVRIQSSKPVSKILRAYVRSINLDQNNQSLNLTEKQIQQQSHKFELLKCHCKDRQEAHIKEINDQAVENAIPENRTLINANLKDGDRVWIRRKQGARKSNGSGNGLSDKKKEKPKERIGDDDALSHVKQENGVQGKGKEREKSVDSEDDEGGTPSSETKPAKGEFIISEWTQRIKSLALKHYFISRREGIFGKSVFVIERGT